MTENPPTIEIDCRGQQCPGPVLRIAREAAAMRDSGGFLTVLADDPAFRPDIEAWARSASAELIEIADHGSHLRAVVRIAGAVKAPPPPPPQRSSRSEMSLDLRGVQCPGPVISLAKMASQHPPGTEVHVIADDPAFPIDLRSWLASGHAELIELDESGPEFHARLRVRDTSGTKPSTVGSVLPASVLPGDPAPASHTTALAPTTPAVSNGCTLLVLHNDHEALLAALLVANGAAAQGMETTLFFTFWGLNLLRGDHPDPTAPRERVSFMQRMMKWMMPKGPTRQKMGKMHFGGIGKGMLGSIMRSQNILGLPELMRHAQELNVNFTACTMSMSVMGITKRDLYPYRNLEYAGVATFVERARHSSINLVF